ncbi:MAG: hypothetical protein H7Z13_03640 [Ferruginibacter sp.]|nr:hypothetical protein [Ferruginibacter sp.]
MPGKLTERIHAKAILQKVVNNDDHANMNNDTLSREFPRQDFSSRHD